MEEQIKTLKTIQTIQSLVILVLLAAVGWLYVGENPTTNDLLHAKGLVIHDENGHPRIAMGFPIDHQFRTRKDTLSGIILLDETGLDRVHLGPHGPLFLGGEYYPRTNNEGWSLFFNDSKGEERSGYGFNDSDNSVGLGMDYGGEHGGEAIYLHASPNLAFMTINADLQEQQGIRDRIVLWHETDQNKSLLKISDTQADGRIFFKAEKGQHPMLQVIDSAANKTTIWQPTPN